MKIQWNSDAAQELLDRLKKADRGMEDAARQVRIVRAALTEANAKQDNRALNELSEQFEKCVRQMNALERELEEFERGVHQAQTIFEEAERTLVRKVNDLPLPTAVPLSDGIAGYGWDRQYHYLPEMRIGGFPGPDWLERITMNVL